MTCLLTISHNLAANKRQLQSSVRCSECTHCRCNIAFTLQQQSRISSFYIIHKKIMASVYTSLSLSPFALRVRLKHQQHIGSHQWVLFAVCFAFHFNISNFPAKGINDLQIQPTCNKTDSIIRTVLAAHPTTNDNTYSINN